MELKLKALAEVNKGKIIAVASEEVEDRAGDVVSVDGWQLKDFKKKGLQL